MNSPLPALDLLHAPWFVGGALVVLHSYLRFNTPPTSRSLTTAGRYHAAAALYTLAMASAWVVLSAFPDALGERVPENVRRLSVPLYVALALTVLLPGIKPLAKHDRKLRAFLHDLAHIPYEALQLTGVLKKASFEPDQDTQIEVKARLESAGFRDKDIDFAPHHDARTLWTKIATLKHHLDGWETSRRYVRFRHEHAPSFDLVEEGYQGLLVKARRLFRQVELLGAERQDPAVRELLGGLEVEFTREACALEKRMCQIISQGVLHSTITGRARMAALEQLGFRIDQTAVGSDRLLDRLVGLFLGFGAYYAFLLIFFAPDTMAAHEKVVRGTMIAAIYVVAVFWALLPKRWDFGEVNDAGRPIAAYALSATAALGFSLFASWAVGALLGGDARWALGELGNKWPWAFMAFSTALVTAINVDNRPRRGLRWLEAGVQAAAAAIAMVGVWWLLALACEECVVPPLERLIASAALTGAVIGFCVPTWYRTRRLVPADGASAGQG